MCVGKGWGKYQIEEVAQHSYVAVSTSCFSRESISQKKKKHCYHSRMYFSLGWYQQASTTFYLMYANFV